MKNLLITTLFALSTLTCFAQIPNGTIAPDFTVTDIDGNSHNLYNYLDSGKTCILNFSTTWAGPCWAYHSSGALQGVYDTLGPAGSDEAMVLFIEVDSATTVQDIEGTGSNTDGDYTEDTNFPLIDDHTIADLYEVNAYPTIFTICPDKLVQETAQMTTWEQLNYVSINCASLFGYNNVNVSHVILNSGICGIDSATVVFQNLGADSLASVDLVLSMNGLPIDTIAYSGNLGTFGLDTVGFEINYTNLESTQFDVDGYNPNGYIDDDPSDNNAFNSFNIYDFSYSNEIFLEFYGATLVWQIYPVGDTTVLWGGGSYYSPNTINSTSINLGDLPDGCYKLFIGNLYFNFNDTVTLSDDQGVIFDYLTNFGSHTEVYFFIDRGDYEVTVYPFMDLNNNSSYDAGTDAVLLNQFFESDTALNYFLSSNGTGSFYYDTTGTLDISYIDNSFWDASPNPQTVTISPPDTLYELYYLMSPDSIFDSIALDIISSTTRCLQESNFWITANNLGTTFADGIVAFTYSDTMNYFAAYPTPDSIVNQTIYFSFDTLAPTHFEQFIVTLSIPNYVFLGEMLDVSATFNSDTNSTVFYSSELVCAYDPNDKQVSPLGDANGNLSIENDTTLTYTIRFQNTGNDTAFNVIVRDTLSEMLDLTSFQFIASSHSPTISIDQQKRVAEFNFQNILLPDSGINQVGSNGFIKFSIDVVDAVQWNDFVDNKAEIYFDFNPAIVTNTVTSVYKLTTNLQETVQLDFDIHPNPTNGLLNLKTEFRYEKIQVINLQGKILKTIEGIQNQIDLNELDNGAYLINLINGKASLSKKVMIAK